jgi:hypothetical protein
LEGGGCVQLLREITSHDVADQITSRGHSTGRNLFRGIIWRVCWSSGMDVECEDGYSCIGCDICFVEIVLQEAGQEVKVNGRRAIVGSNLIERLAIIHRQVNSWYRCSRAT